MAQRTASFAFLPVLLLAAAHLARSETVASLRLVGYTTVDKISTLTEQVAFDDQHKVAYLVGDKKIYLVSVAATPAELLALPEGGSPLEVIDSKELATTITDVYVCGDYVAVSAEGETKVAPGNVYIYSKYNSEFEAGMELLATIKVGSLPDQLEFSKDCSTLLVSNEGEPDGYGDGFTDPEGSVSVINMVYCPDAADQKACSGKPLKATVRTATFTAWNSKDKKAGLVKRGVKLNGPGASVAQDLEPECTTFSADQKTAFVTLQENNAIAVLDVASATITGIYGLGFKNHSQAVNALDASDKDDKTNIRTWPIMGLYMPDEIKSFSQGGVDYIVSANEGDARDWEGLAEEERVGDIIDQLDPNVFPNAETFGQDDQLGRLNVIGGDKNALNDVNGDGKFDRLLSFGARSFSVWKLIKGEGAAVKGLKRVFDSGSQLERLTKQLLPTLFNSEGRTDTRDGRSDNKGPEPEGIAVGDAFSPLAPALGSKRCLFLTTERLSAVFVYDITNPAKPKFQSLAVPPQENGAARMVAPEGITYARYTAAPGIEVPIVLVAYEGEEASGLAVYLVDLQEKK